MEKNQKVIVCDIDDTISFTTNRDWMNATPDYKVINKINDLYEQGWEIHLVTARGSLSCKSRKEADTTYRSQIEIWMERHGVKYTSLSFDKKLAAYYVDDKSLTPEQFCNLDIQTLKSGWSGANVELRDGRVYKTHTDSINAAKWYSIAGSFFNVPQVHSLIGNTICLEYIKPTNDHKLIGDVFNIIEAFKSIPIPPDVRNNTFTNYINRIHNHIKYNYDVPIFNAWNSWYHDYYSHTNPSIDKLGSFCHGDLTLENIINHKNRLYLIDPIYETENTFSSYVLDISKFLYSLLYHNKFTEYNYAIDKFSNLIDFINVSSQGFIKFMVASHAIRVYKYAPLSERNEIMKIFTLLVPQTYLESYQQNEE